MSGGRAGAHRERGGAARDLGRRRSLLREADLRSRRRTTCRRCSRRHCPGLAVICGSASKAYAMTGWRCGWTIAPPAVIAAEHALQSHATSNVSSITQKAALAALTGSQEPVTRMLDEYRQRRDSLHEWLTREPGYRAAKPAGTFYLFLDVTRLLSHERLPHLERLRAGAARRGARRGHSRAKPSTRPASSASRSPRRWTICGRGAGGWSSSRAGTRRHAVGS